MKKVKSISNTELFSGYVVGIGASAGGLDALEKFFDVCPVDVGAAFVVIQHLSPDHKSMMENLLSRHTKMPVTMVEQDMPIEANHVYLISPASVMHMGDGFLHLTPKAPRGLTLPIDIFFTSLAEKYTDRAIGIVLSGTGSDGTRGAAAINSQGGFLLAQDPVSASFDGMPKSFIATGLVDAILPPEELATCIVAYIKHSSISSNIEPRLKFKIDAPNLMLSNEEVLDAILQLLQQACGIDFKEYKASTILRRIDRRMQVCRVSSLKEYFKLLEKNNDEIATLRQDFLISVTSFFRDAEYFHTLEKCTISELVKEKQKTKETIRIWSAGCSTGEEAYTLGMLFIEEFEKQGCWLPLKIFATDVNQQNIDFAAIGSYSQSVSAELSSQRLERFFDIRSEKFVVKNELRQLIVFARHNLLSDPPFTKMDLVVCRNTLIYFKNTAQAQVLYRLQYAVNPQGFLFLGSSETLQAACEDFKIINAKHKLFQRIGENQNNSKHSYEMFKNVPRSASLINKKTLLTTQAKITESETVEMATAALLSNYAPPAVIVNRNYDVIHLFGDLKPYISLREGAASLNLNRTLPSKLMPIASALLNKAAKTNVTLLSEVIHLNDSDGSKLLLRLSARPLFYKNNAEKFLLLCFEKVSEKNSDDDIAEPFDLSKETIERIEVLEHELEATRESLQSTIEELETSNEELQATNEELMASNEELQSSNEELQSVNEELNTVNSEYQEKTGILSQLNADLDNMSKASGIATIFVDKDLRLTRFSQDAVEIFKIRSTDIGRRLDDFAHTLNYPRLIEDIEKTLLLGRMTEREVTAHDNAIFLMRILPYSIPSLETQGAVATFVDITAFHDLKRLQAILDALPEHIAVINHEGTIVLVNQAWKRFAKANGDPNCLNTGIGQNYLTICEPQSCCNDDFATKAFRGVKSVLEGSTPLFSLEYPCHSPTEKRWFVMNVAPITQINNDYGAVISHINISSYYTSETKKEIYQ
jgi:two-component system CheB/CheR fusion protein